MTWPPPSSARPHHAGPGVDVEPAGDDELRRRGRQPAANLGHDVERPQVVADTDDQARRGDRLRQPGRAVRVGGGQRLLDQERDARRDQAFADRHGPVRRHGHPDRRRVVRPGQHRVDVVVRACHPSARRPRRRSCVAPRRPRPARSGRAARAPRGGSRLIQPPPTSPTRTVTQPSLPKMLSSR